MITTLVQFKLAKVNRVQAQAMFSEVAPKFFAVLGLHRKYFLISEDGMTGGDVYLWESREDAERLYTDDFKRSIAEQFGAEPSIDYFQSPMIVDNLTGANSNPVNEFLLP